MSRAYNLDTSDYDRLLVRLRPGKSVRTSVVATIDGRTVTIAHNVRGSNDTAEIAGRISGKKLTRLTLKFTGQKPGNYNIQLRWVMLDRRGKRWSPPVDPFNGMIVEGKAADFSPGLGLIFGAKELRTMRRSYGSAAFAELWRTDLAHAAEQFKVDPASMIRQYALYVPARFGRPWDEKVNTGHDGLLLAMVGLITRNDGYMRQAARHAVALARTDEWAEGFIDRFPEGNWRHCCFAPNVVTIKESLLLDWTWNWLTADGRAIVRKAIRQKGLPYLKGGQEWIPNQGSRFTKGLVLGNMAVARSPDDPRLRARIRSFIRKLDRKLEEVSRPDGTFSEGMNYGKGTMASLPFTYLAASRCLGVPVRTLVSPLVLKSMRFLLDAEQGVPPAFAAFCAGPLSEKDFAGQCVPASVLAGYDGPGLQSTWGNFAEYIYCGMIPVWAPKLSRSARPLKPRPFAAYPDGGWVFMAGGGPAAARVSFESGLWDGYGHSWFHKHAVTLDAWGERLLVTRKYLGYQDARSDYTMSTKLYNTFAPAERSQDASGTPGRGAKLLLAKDLGPAAVIESDNATAWKAGVRKAVRRVIFLRPNVLVVQDVAEFAKPEPGVQSWNSFAEWQIAGELTCLSKRAAAGVRLTCLSAQPLRLSVGQDSVSQERTGVVPVHRAEFTTPAAKRHQLITVIEAVPPRSKRKSTKVNVIDREMMLIEVVQGRRVVRIQPESGSAGLACSAKDGTLSFLLKDGRCESM